MIRKRSSLEGSVPSKLGITDSRIRFAKGDDIGNIGELQARIFLNSSGRSL